MESVLFRMSGLYADEGWNPEGLELDCRDIPGINSYCSAEALEKISGRLPSVSLPALRWIDSGDYHYLSHILAKDVGEPFALLLLDNHPDNQDSAFGADILSCGNWVTFLQRECPCLNTVVRNGAGRLPEGLPVYISLDLDVMSPQYFRTNWDQGRMTPGRLESVLAEAFRRKVLAVDVCGGITAAKGADRLSLRRNRDFREWLSVLLDRLGG